MKDVYFVVLIMHRKLILMLEDDSDDRYITEQAIEELGLDVDIEFYSDSIQFLHFLAGTSLYPSLILIDYNSTPENGLAV